MIILTLLLVFVLLPLALVALALWLAGRWNRPFRPFARRRLNLVVIGGIVSAILLTGGGAPVAKAAPGVHPAPLLGQSAIAQITLKPGPAPEGVGNWQENLLWVLIVGVAVMQVVNFFRPNPALHKQFADREETDETLKEVKETLREMRKEFSDWSADHYKARGRMHQRLNATSNALSFLSGTMAQKGDPAAEHLRKLVEKVTEGHEQHD